MDPRLLLLMAAAVSGICPPKENKVEICNAADFGPGEGPFSKVSQEIVLNSGETLKLVNPKLEDGARPVYRCEITIRHADEEGKLKGQLITRVRKECSQKSARVRLMGVKERKSYWCGNERNNVNSVKDSIKVVFRAGPEANDKEGFTFNVNAL